jgi:twitching motility two-component system response regulator PilH
MPYRVLVVDDNEDYARVIRRILTGASFEVVVAENPKLARVELKKGLPDVIVLDVAMPEENGVEFCERLKRSKRTRRVPVCIVSAHPEMTVFLRESPYGPDAVLAKPFDVQDFVGTVKRLAMVSDGNRSEEVQR